MVDIRIKQGVSSTLRTETNDNKTKALEALKQTGELH